MELNVDADQILNIASSVGLNNKDPEVVIQFAIEMQALSLINFANWCRANGNISDRVSWVDAAINAELMAGELGPISINC